MPKVNNLRVRAGLMRRCQAIKSELNKLRSVIGNLKEFNAMDETTIKFTLNHLLDEIRNATRDTKERCGE